MTAVFTMRVARVVILLVACGAGCFAVVSSGTKRPPAVLEEHQEESFCSKLSQCTDWCSDCKKRQVLELKDILDECEAFTESQDYKYASYCPDGHTFKVCICTEENSACRSCNAMNSNTTSQLLCLSHESGEAEVQISLPNSRNLQPLSQTCPTCSCSTDAPTTRLTTTRMSMQTVYHHEDDIDPRPTTKSITTAAGNGQSKDVVIIALAAGGAVIAIVLVVSCLICCCRRRRNKAAKTEIKDMEYADIDDIRTMRSQASMMSRQNLISNEGLNHHLPCGHRQFNNEMYGMNAIGNGATISTQQQAPELPGNHPMPSVPPPMPSQYQGLNRGPMRSGSAIGNGPCPHCHQKSIPERSATAPLMDRPTGLDMSSNGVEGARNPYMALIKTNTCPTPGTPPAPAVCDCHSRPLSECSSVTESLQSDRQRNHTHAADALNATTTQEADQCQGGNEDAPEDPYYFRMQTAVEEKEVSPPQSPQYFKLEDAETIPLDGEDTPMLYSPDSNGNNVRTKTLPANTDSVDTAKEPSSKTVSQASLADGQSRSPTPGDNPVKSPSRAVSPDLAMQKKETSRSVEGLPNGEYMHLVNGKSKVTSV